MNPKRLLKEYFYFTRKDIIAVLIIGISIVLVILLPRWNQKEAPISHAQNEPDTTLQNALAKIISKKNSAELAIESNVDTRTYQYDYSPNSYFTAAQPELFYFDPNTLPESGWKRLGIREKTIQTILNYLSKGGRFKHSEDLQKIYGLRQNEFERIAPYIKIEAEKNSFASKSTKEERSPLGENKSYPDKTYKNIEINTATLEDWDQLPGIGEILSKRILKYKEKLGGFYSIQQIAETYGLPDSTFQKIKPYLLHDNYPLSKININTATLDELKAHPYIGYKLAKPIVAYREQHGNFSQIKDLKKIMMLTESILEKITPYLTL